MSTKILSLTLLIGSLLFGPSCFESEQNSIEIQEPPKPLSSLDQLALSTCQRQKKCIKSHTIFGIDACVEHTRSQYDRIIKEKKVNLNDSTLVQDCLGALVDYDCNVMLKKLPEECGFLEALPKKKK